LLAWRRRVAGLIRPEISQWKAMLAPTRPTGSFLFLSPTGVVLEAL